ncbi:hypothetical protein B0H67DRAFT_648163 [Lasiosphaeris hirsuta]|uniref:Heterokaryon incompatibility domain-containing protein n=1 Tax=Lasiosphaeris hirsuta TaxID=260670 RepID=A0AA40A2E0_9PEZI|nr:hypothetical protein B0H67DRAFT_648163 [Lasiosphaeris hirsuta]
MPAPDIDRESMMGLLAVQGLTPPRKSFNNKPGFFTMTRLDDVRVKWTLCLCWETLGGLANRDWFSRAWVVQEAALSQNVRFVCGRFSIPWGEMLRAPMFIPAIPIRPLSDVALTSYMVVIESLREQLAKGNCKATVSLDKIYAFCGLVDGPKLQVLGLQIPDYQEKYREADPGGAIELRNGDTVLGLEGFIFDEIGAISKVADKKPPTTWRYYEYGGYKRRIEDTVIFLQRCLEWEAVTNARSGSSYVGGGDMLDALLANLARPLWSKRRLLFSPQRGCTPFNQPPALVRGTDISGSSRTANLAQQHHLHVSC